ncbi:MAG: hypothetical protein KDD66_07545 [Bdellovibrionales bacterium]|nr:hypothetical protein [Bdellovibrionales bacterium]
MLGERNLTQARLLAMEARPWYGPFLARFEFVKRDSGSPLYHDPYGRIYYNDGYCSFASVESLKVLLLQIAEMFIRGHHWRGQGRNPQLWSFACLLETASSMKKQGFKLPKESLTPGWFRWTENKPAEFYYRKLAKLERIRLPVTMLDDRGRPKSVEVELYWEDGQLQYAMTEQAMVGMFGDEQPDMQGLTPLLDPLLFTGMLMEVQELASEFGEQQVGDMPDWLLRQARANESVLPWHEYLRMFLGDAERGSFGSRSSCWTMPNMLQAAIPSGIVLPAHEERSPNVAMVVDTSGSMDQELLGRALSEIDGLLRTLEVTEGLTVIPTDAAAHTVQNVFAASQLKLEGNGGTNLGVGIDEAGKLMPKPEAVIVITDGYTPWPEEGPKDMEVVVVVVSKQWPQPEQKKRNPAPKWARMVIEMFPYKKQQAA